MADVTQQRVRCGLCPKRCAIPPGHSGECRVRINADGVLRAVTYGRPSAVHVDPMEKKPLFHFFPGASILSLGTVGCNFHCKNCQNAELSQGDPETMPAYDLQPAALPETARRQGCAHVAYTYNEPLVSYEYVRDCCRAARDAGLRNVLITAGYINEAPLRALAPLVDAVNVDIKAFQDEFYRNVCDGTLEPVLRSVLLFKEAGTHVELTNLLIPTLNDSDAFLDPLCEWIRDRVGAETPMHFSRFFPSFRMTRLPPTPIETLLHARDRAHAAGLRHVYVGNAVVPEGENTRCAGCGETVVRRQRYVVTENRLTPQGACPACGRTAYGVWS